MSAPSSSAQALNGAAPSIVYNRLRMDALGSLEADNNGVTTNGGGSFVNNSGGTRSVGDVVIYDTTANDDFTTTTTVADGRVLGVVIDGSIANAVKGAVQTRGPALVNVTGSVARGDYLVTSGTAGQAQSNGPCMRPGVFAVALEASSAGTVIALLFGHCVFGSPQNQLVNGGLENWQRGTGPFTANAAYTADRFQIVLVGTDALSVSKDTTNIDLGSNAAAACTFTLGTGGGSTCIQQQLKSTDGYQFASRTISLSVRVRTSTANAVRVHVSSDGTGTPETFSAFHPGDGAYHTLTATVTPASNATVITINIYFAASCTAYVDNVMLVLGQTPWDYVPMSPADDLARCQRYYEILEQANSTGAIWMGNATAAQTWSFYIPFRAIKGGTPTFTKNGTWTLSNCAQPTLTGDANGFLIQVAASGAGIFSIQNTGAGTTMVAEWNP